jgi:hypothetical protein
MTRLRLACLSLLCSVLLLSSSVVAQVPGSHYTATVDPPTISDGTANCVVGQQQCWILINNTVILSQISAGPDGTVYGVDQHNNLWTLPLNTHSWQSSPLSPMTEVSVNSATDIYGLQLDSTFCGAPEKRVYHYTGGADFQPLSLCALHITSAPDGTLYRIRSSGNVSHLADQNNTWVTDTSAGGNGTPIKISAGSAANVWLVTSTGVIKALTLNTSTNTSSFVVVPGYGTDVSTTGDGGAATTFIVGQTNVTNDVFQYNYTTSTWTAINGWVSKISTGGLFNTMGINGVGGTSHFNSILVTITARTAGYFDCSVRVQGCPVGSVHTATTLITWASKGINPTSAATSSGAPAAQLSAVQSAYTTDCDPIFGDPNAPECQATVNAKVFCSIMGAFITTELSWKVEFEHAYTKLTATTGKFFGCVTVLGARSCQQPVTPWCQPGTTPPDLNPPTVWTAPTPLWTYYWDDNAECARMHNGALSINSAWVCGPGIVLRTQANGLGWCTYNP